MTDDLAQYALCPHGHQAAVVLFCGTCGASLRVSASAMTLAETRLFVLPCLECESRCAERASGMAGKGDAELLDG